MNKALLDTEIFSELLKGKNAEVLRRSVAYQTEHQRFTLSCVTVLEIVRGWHRLRREDRIQELLQKLPALEVLAFEIDTATIAGRMEADLVRSGRVMGRADTMIAATAIHHRVVLVTGNVAHYENLRQLGYPLLLDNWKEPSP